MVTNDSQIAVVIVDDDDVVRDALHLIINGTAGMACVRAYEQVEPLLEADLGRIDVILLDIGLPGMSGIEAIKPINERWPRAEILMLTVYADEGQVFQALCAGATGYLLKNTPPTEIVDAVRDIHAGGAPMTATIARKVVNLFREPDQDEALTDRENEVLDQIIEGKTNRQIAEELFISVNTVAFHVKQIYEKLHVHSRAEAVAKAMRRRPPRSAP
jgi:DNA-binding NarL/FixJ family response regulator